LTNRFRLEAIVMAALPLAVIVVGVAAAYVVRFFR
jgi:hypothetical protein